MGLYPHPSDQVEPFQADEWKGYRDRSFPEKQVGDILKAFLSQDSALSVCHQSRHRTTYRINGNTGGMTAVFLKHYQCRKLALYNPRSYFRFGHARKSFRLSNLIAKTGIGTPRVLFYLRENSAGLGSDALLATGQLPGFQDLRPWVKQRYPLLNNREKEAFAKALASFMARLHQNGICHGAFDSSTLLDPDTYQFCLIDLDHVRIFGSMLTRDRTKQLKILLERLPEIGADEKMSHLFHETYSTYFGMTIGT